jgi:hypothetical protein
VVRSEMAQKARLQKLIAAKLFAGSDTCNEEVIL